MNEPRKHHYVSKFLLAGFTRQSANDGDLHVLDLKRGMLRRSTPNNEGHKRDHYRVNAPDPFAVEEMVGRVLEDPAKTVISEIIDSTRLPEDEHKREVLLTFVANLAARVRSQRKQANRFHGDAAALIENLTGSSYEVYRQAMMGAGFETVTETDYADYRAYLASESRPKWTLDQTTLVVNELKMAERLFPYLAGRHWCLAVSERPAAEFVISDSPVALMDPRAGNYLGPGFGLRSTTVLVPLWRRGVLIGSSSPCETRVVVDREGVADINMQTVLGADELVWSPRPRFPCRWTDGQLLTDPARLIAARKSPDAGKGGASERDGRLLKKAR